MGEDGAEGEDCEKKRESEEEGNDSKVEENQISHCTRI